VPQIGPLEILTLGAVALIVFGPQKLPEVARSIGRFMSEVRRVATDVKSEFSAALEDDEDTATTSGSPTVADEDSAAIEEAAPRRAQEER